MSLRLNDAGPQGRTLEERAAVPPEHAGWAAFAETTVTVLELRLLLAARAVADAALRLDRSRRDGQRGPRRRHGEFFPGHPARGSAQWEYDKALRVYEAARRKEQGK